MSSLPEGVPLESRNTDVDGKLRTAEPSCRLAGIALAVPGEVRCPVCHNLVPPEHIGYKLHCRRCGYLESCCNPI